MTVNHLHQQRGWLPYALVGLFAGIGLFCLFTTPIAVKGFQFVAGDDLLKSGCNIKGNISVTGERIYHMPGQKYYSATRIDTRMGERWFCSEEEARAAGWRKARV